MSKRKNHEWRTICVGEKMIRYKLYGTPRKGSGNVYKGKFQDSDGTIHEISLETRDKGESSRIHREVVEEKLLKEERKTTGIKQALRDYEAFMRAEKITEKHIALKIRRIETICDGLGLKMIHEIDETKVKIWISQQQRRKKTKPLSDRSAHHYAASIKSFTRWMHFTPKLLKENPLRGLKIHRRGELKATYKRRAFSDVEFAKLIANAMASDKVFRGHDGLSRSWLYRCGDATGYRCQELASITPAACHLDGDNPYIEVDCTISKRRKQERQYVTPEFAAGFRQFIAGRNRSEQIWPRDWFSKATMMMKIDMDGIEQETNAGRLTMHSLRHTHVSRTLHAAGKLGISNREVMRQCRLSSETLLATYGHNHDENRERLVAETRRQTEFERDSDGMESL